jgi:hypothetical protein
MLTRDPLAESAYARPIVDVRLTISAALILFTVWGRARTQPGATASRWRGRLGRGATVASLVGLLVPAGCFQVNREALRGEWNRGLAEEEQEPYRVPEQIYTDDAKADIGDKAKRSIPMPKKPYSWQKVAPCDQGEREKVTGCWIHSDDPPPCSDAAVESAGECYVPVPARPKHPSTLTPKPTK